MFRQQKAPLFTSALPLHLEDLGEDFIEDRLAFLRKRSPAPVSKEGLSDAFERIGKSPEFLNEVILHLIIGGNGDVEQAIENWWKSHPDAGRNVIDLDHGEARVFHQSRACLLKHWALFKRTSESAPAYAFDRVHAALLGEFDANQLNIDEERIFMDALAEYMSQPYAEGQALAAKMYREGGYVGDDENGRLVRTLPGGGTEAIE